MDCEKVREQFSALLDGELAPDDRSAVEKHLSTCSDCLRELDGLRKVDRLYKDLSPHHAPADFEARVRESVRPNVFRLPRRRLARMPLWPLLSAAAVFMLVAGLLVVQVRSLPTRERFSIAKTDTGAGQAEGMKSEISDLKSQMAESEPIHVPLADSSKDREALIPTVPSEAAQNEQEEVLGRHRPARRVGPATPGSAANQPYPGIQASPSDMLTFEDKDAPRPATRPYATEGISTEPGRAAVAAVPMVKVEEAGRGQEQVGALYSEPVKTVTLMAKPLEAGQGRGADALHEEPAREPVEQWVTLKGQEARARPAMSAEATPPPALSRADSAEPAPTTREVGQRRFVLRSGIWVEEGYQGQPTRPLERESKALMGLVKSHPDLAEIFALGDRVIFRQDETWYRVEPMPNS